MAWTREEMIAFDLDACEIGDARKPTRCAELGLVLETAEHCPVPDDGFDMLRTPTVRGWLFVRKPSQRGTTIARNCSNAAS
jgi:hypothetical protein